MKLSKLISVYGEEVDIIAGGKRGTFVKMDKSGLILKDPYAYAAGFLDADGYISITKRGEPRAGFVATGSRGKIHCEQLQKTLGCGVLQLDQKIYKDSQRSQHRLQFYSKGDIRKLLTQILPHLKMKDIQAKAVLAFIDESDNVRKDELPENVLQTLQVILGFFASGDSIVNEVSGDAIIDRITHNAHIIETGKKSARLEETLKSNNTPKEK